jgi:hypothetical protein
MPDFVFDDSEAVERVLLARGWYTTRIEAAEVRVAKNSGNPYLAIQLRTEGGVHDNAPIFVNWPTKGRGAGITKSAFRAFRGSAMAGPGSTEDLIGLRADVFVIQRVWAEEDNGDGELQNKITKYRASDPAEATSIF